MAFRTGLCRGRRKYLIEEGVMISFSEDQRFIVTGASSGIGEGVAVLLNELGASVVGIGRDIGRLEAMRAKAAFPERVFVEQKDLAERISELPDYVSTLRVKYGKFSGLACCAGITLNQPLQMKDYAISRNLFDVDYFAPMFLAKAFGDRRNTVGAGTSVVLVSSCAALRCDRAMSDYAGAKSALCASARSIAREWAPRGLRINCVLPSDIDTPMTQAITDIIQSRKDEYPMGIGKVSDVANFIAFLLSDKARWLTGQKYVVDAVYGLL
jgi:NAD(P)-dependent dehydrogenase (short-subunit alcohol dehydrogenase family)